MPPMEDFGLADHPFSWKRREGQNLTDKLDAVWKPLAELEQHAPDPDKDETDWRNAAEDFLALLEFMARHSGSAGMWSTIAEWCRARDLES